MSDQILHFRVRIIKILLFLAFIIGSSSLVFSIDSDQDPVLPDYNSSLQVYPCDGDTLLTDDVTFKITVRLSDDSIAKINPDTCFIKKEKLQPYLEKVISCPVQDEDEEDSDISTDEDIAGNEPSAESDGQDVGAESGSDSGSDSGENPGEELLTRIPLTCVATDDDKVWELVPDDIPGEGTWRVVIPDHYFRIDYGSQFVDTVKDGEVLKSLTIPGTMNIKGEPWVSQPMFSIHDDDAIDAKFSSSGPSSWMQGGYWSRLFPVVASLGLKANLSVEGWRVGMDLENPQLNKNGRVIKLLQDSCGWEVMAHSMTARYPTNNWAVDSLNTELADKILSTATNTNIRSNSTHSVFDLSTGIQYSVNSTLDGWRETPTPWIKPYVVDYETGNYLFYNPSFPIDYQWGRWFEVADSLGFRAKTWVTPNITSTHANVPLINAICPNGFADKSSVFYNLPPLASTACRMMVEGQSLPGYKGETNTDNTFNQAHFEFYKSQIDECAEKGGWIIIGLHAYRPCWKNSLPGALVSEGGDYPDEWVWPFGDNNPLTYGLEPPVSLGISDWSEWHPCPGTRLYMLWQLLKYAVEKGVRCVSSSEGFEVMGNKAASGYYEAGEPIGVDIYNDHNGIKGTSDNYDYYVVGADGSVAYNKLLHSDGAESEFSLKKDNTTRIEPVTAPSMIKTSNLIFTVNGMNVPDADIETLSPGLYIIDGRKVIITHL